MPSASTRRALADRAERAADLMKFWMNNVRSEMEQQNVQPFSNEGPPTIALRPAPVGASPPSDFFFGRATRRRPGAGK